MCLCPVIAALATPNESKQVGDASGCQALLHVTADAAPTRPTARRDASLRARTLHAASLPCSPGARQGRARAASSGSAMRAGGGRAPGGALPTADLRRRDGALRLRQAGPALRPGAHGRLGRRARMQLPARRPAASRRVGPVERGWLVGLELEPWLLGTQNACVARAPGAPRARVCGLHAKQRAAAGGRPRHHPAQQAKACEAPQGVC